MLPNRSIRRPISISWKSLAAKKGAVLHEYSSRRIIMHCGRPSASTQVRIWRASGWKQLAWRDQSRGPLGPEIIAYISATAATISARSFSALLGDTYGGG